MSKLGELIDKLCPDGVEYKALWELTIWDKKFNGVDKSKQRKIISYKYYLSTDFAKVERKNGNIKYISTGISGEDRYTTEELAGDYLAEGEVVCIPWGGTPNVKYHNGKFVTGDNRIATSLDINVLNNKFLYYWMQSKINIIAKFYRGSGIKHPSMKDILDIQIPVPPLEVQYEIVKLLDKYTKFELELESKLKTELEARKKQYEYYRNKLLNFDETANRCGCTHTHTHGYSKEQIEWMELGKIGCVRMCRRILKSQTNTETGVPFYKIGTFGKKADAYISEKTYNEYKNKYKFPKKGDILISCSGTIGRIVVYNGEPAYFQDSNIVWLEHDESIVLNKYLKYCYLKNPWNISTGGTIARLYNDNILKTKIPVPSLKEQERIVKILDKFEKLCNDISEGLLAEIEARKKQYEYYRDKLLTFKELKVNE